MSLNPANVFFFGSRLTCPLSVFLEISFPSAGFHLTALWFSSFPMLLLSSLCTPIALRPAMKHGGSAGSNMWEPSSNRPRGSHPLCNPLPHRIRADLHDQYNMQQVTMCDFQGHKRYCSFLYVKQKTNKNLLYSTGNSVL